jgi:prepilin-type N-terminal cleavage/methylation domain-containing protein
MTAPRDREAGFTLVEVMIALALQAVGLAARGLGGLSARAERLDERRSLEMLMRRALAAAVAEPLAAGEPAFVGRPTRLTFLSLVEDGGAGIYRITLDAPSRGGFVTLARRLVGGSADVAGDESVLLRDVSGFAIAYFGADPPGSEARWHRQWEGKTYLPDLVRISFAGADDAATPPILLRPRDAG